MHKNPLLHLNFLNNYQIPFNQIKPEHFVPAINHYLIQARDRILKLKNTTDYSFDQTIAVLEQSDFELQQVVQIFSNLHALNKNEDLDNLATVISEIQSNWANEVLFDKELFNLIQKVDVSSLNSEQKKLYLETIKDFKISGVNASLEVQTQLKEIDSKLSALEIQFGNQTLADTALCGLAVELKDLVGLNEVDLKIIEDKGKERNLDKNMGYIDDDDYENILTFVHNRKVRQEFYFKNRTIGNQENNNDNRPLIIEILQLRKTKARLLGFKNYPEMILEDRMAKNTSTIKEMHQNLLTGLRPKSKETILELQSFAKKKDQVMDLGPWDHHYYINRLLKEKLNLDLNQLKEHLELNQVQKTLFSLINQLFKVTFQSVKHNSIYHNSVQAFEVYDEGEFCGTLYLDLFNRENKEKGGWSNTLISPRLDVKPTIVVACNFNSSSHVLLSWEEVKTLFHEVGHALHQLVSKCKYSSQAGNVAWDFVELPSQFMENWAEDPSVLSQFTHYKTNQTLSPDVLAKIPKIKKFMSSLNILRMIGLGELDLALHEAESIENVNDFENNVMSKFQLWDSPPGCRSASFTHIFAGGYAVGYYSYLWANILDSDAFLFCQQSGGIKSPYLIKFKELMAVGGSVVEAENYRQFRGQDPTIKAFLTTMGI